MNSNENYNSENNSDYLSFIENNNCDNKSDNDKNDSIIINTKNIKNCQCHNKSDNTNQSCSCSIFSKLQSKITFLKKMI